jgi:hypothetical protein
MVPRVDPIQLFAYVASAVSQALPLPALYATLREQLLKADLVEHLERSATLSRLGADPRTRDLVETFTGDREILETLVDLALEPAVAMRILAVAEGVGARASAAEASGADPDKAAAEVLAALPHSHYWPAPNERLVAAYERALAKEFPWAESDQLSFAAIWCALRDEIEPDEDGESYYREDANFLNRVLGDAPDLEPASISRRR